MKTNKRFACKVLMLVFIFTVNFVYTGQTSNVFAEKGDDYWLEYPGENDKPIKEPVAVDKPDWTIQFNEDVDKTTVNDTTIYIEDEGKNIFEVKYDTQGSKVILKSLKDYEYNTKYTLYIDKGVKSETKKELSQPRKMTFTTEEEPSEGIIAEGTVSFSIEGDFDKDNVALNIFPYELGLNGKYDQNGYIQYYIGGGLNISSNAPDFKIDNLVDGIKVDLTYREALKGDDLYISIELNSWDKKKAIYSLKNWI